MKTDVIASLGGLPLFLEYFTVGLGLLLLFLVIYIWLTPYAEFRLIRSGNVAASASLGGALVGFALPLTSSIVHSASLGDMVVWAVVAMVVQLLAYAVVRFTVPALARDMSEGHLASGVWLAVVAVVFGMLDAACMTP